jgi:hypothetical protein
MAKSDGDYAINSGETAPPGATDNSMETGEICIPLAALASPDEGDQMVEPSNGDIVPFSGECKVNRTEGKNAYIKITAVNGQKLDKTPGPPGEDEEEASIRASLGNGDQGGSGMNSYVSSLIALLLLLWSFGASAQPMTQTYSSLQQAPRADSSSNLVDWWLVKARPTTMVSCFGYNNGSQQFLQFFDTASTNGPLIYVSGMNSTAEFFTNSVTGGSGEVMMGERIQLTNNFGAAAGIYYAVTTNIAGVFRLATSLANAQAGTVVNLTNNSSSGVLLRVPEHSMAMGAADNFSVIVPNTGMGFGKGIVAAVSTTAATYTAGAKDLTLFITLQP